MPHEQLYLDALEERKKIIYEKPVLRPYQEEIVNEVEATLAFDDLCIVGASMGAGKSIIISELCRKFNKEGKSVAVVTNISALVPQIAKHLTAMGVEHNIVKAGMHDWKPERGIHLIMEQSFHAKKREELDLTVDILIKDEWHIGVNQKRYEDIKTALATSGVIGLTATPIDERGYLLAPKENIIFKGTTAELISEGYLVKPKYFVPKWSQLLDYSKVGMSGNDYSETGLREIIDTPEFTEMAIKAMEEMNFQNKQTAVYCAGIEHAENFAKALKKKGYECEVVHSKRPQEENTEAIESFRSNNTKCLISVSSLLIGFDAPNMELLVNMRPTRILRLWLQLGGRCLRMHPNKEYGEILDLGQCVSSLGFLEDTIPLVTPGEKKKLKKEMEKRSKPIITTLAGEAPTEMQREIVLQKIEELEKKAKDYTKQTTTDIMGMFELEDDFEKLALYALEIESRIRGTRYGKYTATWIAAPWRETVNKYPQHEKLLINQFKKQAKGKIRRGSKISGLHYTVAWIVEESDLKHLFGTSWRKDMPDIDEDDIPF